MVSCHIFSRSDFRLVYSTNSELDFVCTVQYTSIVHAMKIVGQFLVRYGPGRGGCVTKDEFSEFGMRASYEMLRAIIGNRERELPLLKVQLLLATTMSWIILLPVISYREDNLTADPAT